LEQIKEEEELEKQQKVIESKMDRERRQAYKLEQSYISLRKHELEKERELKKRADLRMMAYNDKHRDLVTKFEKAEQIRNGHKALQHAKYFHS
jgi:hypothetical protein